MRGEDLIQKIIVIFLVVASISVFLFGAFFLEPPDALPWLLLEIVCDEVDIVRDGALGVRIVTRDRPVQARGEFDLELVLVRVRNSQMDGVFITGSQSGPRESRYVDVRLPVLSLLLAAYPIIAFFRGPYRRRWRWARGQCPECSYILTGNVSGICPECGERI